MKFYKLRFFCALAFIFLASGCNDHPVLPVLNPEPVTNERLILTSGMLYGFSAITYNQKSMPTKYTKDQVGESVNIIYASNQAVYETIENGQLQSRQVYELQNGVAVKQTFYSVNGNGQQTEIFVETYAYKSGKLDKEAHFENGQLVVTSQYVYNGDDISSIVATDNNGIIIRNETFQYTDMPDKSGSLSQWHFMDGHLFPRKSRNLMKERVIEKNGVILAKMSFSYVLDALGYVTHVDLTYGNGEKEQWNNTWQ